MSKKVLIICPHPDDAEAFASQLCMQAVQAKWEVHQVLATCDEYGTPINKFKGQRIKRIRYLEMLKAQRLYGVDKNGKYIMQLHWMNYIDGFVPQTKSAVFRLKVFIQKIKPDIIIGPDPFIYYDSHVDHIAVGKNYYLALRSLVSLERPRLMLYFQTLMPDFFLPKLHYKRVNLVRSAHLSQWTPRMVKIIEKFNFIVQIGVILKHGYVRKVEGYRLVTFNSSHNIPSGFAKILFFFF
ncbi:PIG-L deacetylase family protein [Candidatus Harpocratesius sp.]